MNLADQVYRFKCTAVLVAHLNHKTLAAAARSLGIHRNTFMIWLKRAREMGDE